MADLTSDRCICPTSDPSLPAGTPILSVECPIHGAAARKLAAEAIEQGKTIMAQPPGRCELCGAVERTRPYGPNGEEVCYSCGMKDEAAAQRGFERRFGG